MKSLIKILLFSRLKSITLLKRKTMKTCKINSLKLAVAVLALSVFTACDTSDNHLPGGEKDTTGSNTTNANSGTAVAQMTTEADVTSDTTNPVGHPSGGFTNAPADAPNAEKDLKGTGTATNNANGNNSTPNNGTNNGSTTR
jgi:hypothetical protein